MDFKVGDRVRIKIGAVDMSNVHTDHMKKYEGTTGTIEEVTETTGEPFYQVFGFYWAHRAVEPAVQIVPVPKPTWRIIIEGDENTSRAKYVVGKKVIKETTAKRYHKDRHDPGMAARALIGKMFPETERKEEPKKYFTGKVVCVECPEGVWLTVGKIYEVNDGTMSCDVKYVDIDKVTSVENLNSRVKKGVKFIEIKE